MRDMSQPRRRPGSAGAAGAAGAGEAVQVVVRCRPMSGKEASQGHTQIIDMWPQRGEHQCCHKSRQQVDQ